MIWMAVELAKQPVLTYQTRTGQKRYQVRPTRRHGGRVLALASAVCGDISLACGGIAGREMPSGASPVHALSGHPAQPSAFDEISPRERHQTKYTGQADLGTQLVQELIADGCHGVTRYQPKCGKI